MKEQIYVSKAYSWSFLDYQVGKIIWYNNPPIGFSNLFSQLCSTLSIGMYKHAQTNSI